MKNTSRSSLDKALAMMSVNGSYLRTITKNTPNITNRLRVGRKVKAEHKFRFGDTSYSTDDHLTCAYILMSLIAQEVCKKIHFVTISLNDEETIKLWEVAEKTYGPTVSTTVARWFRYYPAIENAIVVVERSHNSNVITSNGIRPRLHLHILCLLSESDAEQLQRDLLLDKRKRIQIKDEWVSKYRYSDLDAIEEELLGPMPFDEPQGSDEWASRYKKYINGTLMVCTRHPICLRAVDYLTKELNKPIGRGPNYSLIGLNGVGDLRRELAKLCRILIKSEVLG
ncbi:hypothetical protein [Vibrio inusitatus]|nr:hypothetical protein [Vibrio inusitatus]